MHDHCCDVYDESDGGGNDLEAGACCLCMAIFVMFMIISDGGGNDLEAGAFCLCMANDCDDCNLERVWQQEVGQFGRGAGACCRYVARP